MTQPTSLHSQDPHGQETVIGALRNAAQIAQLWSMPETSTNARARTVFADIARLLTGAIEGLNEPNEAAKTAAYHELQRAANAAAQLVTNGGRDAPEFLDDRQLRDCVAVILSAQLKGTL